MPLIKAKPSPPTPPPVLKPASYDVILGGLNQCGIVLSGSSSTKINQHIQTGSISIEYQMTVMRTFVAGVTPTGGDLTLSSHLCRLVILTSPTGSEALDPLVELTPLL